MFCPNCGNNCHDANFCPNCGQDLRGVVIGNGAPKSESKKDINYYYDMYAPDKEAAMVALRADTGMSAFEALQAIDAVFDERQHINVGTQTRTQHYPANKKELFRIQKSELDKSGQVYCPKCLSTSISANQKGFGFVRGAVGAAVGLDVGLIAGGIGSKKVICTCLKCGYQWKAGKK